MIDVDRQGVRVSGPRGEQRIESRTILWAAGVAASGFTSILNRRAGATLDRAGRVMVDQYCNIPGHPEIFVIGDAALLNDRDGKPLPGVAPTAMQQGTMPRRRSRNVWRGGKSHLSSISTKEVWRS